MTQTSVLGYIPVDKAGDTMTGDLILNADPTDPLGAATKDYVDTEVAGIPAGAPTDATYITQTPSAGLSNEQAMSALATGIVKNTTGTGVQSIAVEGTDYYAPGGAEVAVTDGGTGLGATTANQLLYSSANNVIAGLATANSGLLVTSGAGVPSISTVIPNGVTATTQAANDNSQKIATTAYADAVAASGGGFSLIATATASASATVDFSNNLSSTYDTYEFVFSQVIPATDAQEFWCRVGTGAGPTWIDGAGTYSWAGGYYTSAAAGSNSSSDTKMVFSTGGGVGNAAGESINGTLRIFNPSSAATHKYVRADFAAERSDPILASGYMAGHYKANTAVTSFRFQFASGNTASGFFYLYALKKS